VSGEKLETRSHVMKYLGAVALWPTLFLALCLATWVAAYVKINESRHAAEKKAVNHAASMAKTYSEQLSRTVQQINLLSLNAKYDWEHHRSQLDLQDQVKQGLYPSNDFSLTIADHTGIALTSTLGGPPIDIKDRAYYIFHKLNDSATLRVDPEKSISRRSGRAVIRFTRRLEKANGSFDGIVIVSVTPAFLATFSDEAFLGARDFISVRHESGTLLASKKGKEIQGTEVHINPPLFNGTEGVLRVSGDRYKDGVVRIVAWRKVDGYPLVAYVGLAETDATSAYANEKNNYLQFAWAATFLFIACGAVGSLYSRRIALRKRQAQEISATFHLAIDDAREGFYMVRAVESKGHVRDFIIEDCNERGAAMFNYPKQALIGARLSQISLTGCFTNTFAACNQAMKAGFFEDELTVDDPVTGERQWLYRRLVRSNSGLAVTIRDVTEAKRNELMLQKWANTDELTGLPNRHCLLHLLPAALRNAAVNDQMFVVMFLDLDNFKHVNDSLGHAFGDNLLKMVAERLKGILRDDDMVVRLGGDEFTVLLKTVSGMPEVETIAARIIESLGQDFVMQGRVISIGASIGISCFPADGIDADTLIQKADIAMYAAKDDGKNTYRFYEQYLFDRIKNDLHAEDELASAIKSDQFIMFYQPRVRAGSGEITGLEALVRWQHPTRGVVMPGHFIPIAERTGTIVQLGALIIDKVCSQISRWKTENGLVLSVSVNVSPRQLEEGGIDDIVVAALTRHQVSPGALELELTESSMMSESADVMSQLAALRILGIDLHVDDFGTGYSSLSRIQQTDMQVIKIDRAFTSRLGTSPQANALVKTIVLMAQALNMSVIAEGVETVDQLSTLRDMHCEEVQGYLLSHPLPAADVPDFIRHWDFHAAVFAEPKLAASGS